MGVPRLIRNMKSVLADDPIISKVEAMNRAMHNFPTAVIVTFRRGAMPALDISTVRVTVAN
jgi:hypothetical protein